MCLLEVEDQEEAAVRAVVIVDGELRIEERPTPSPASTEVLVEGARVSAVIFSYAVPRCGRLFT